MPLMSVWNGRERNIPAIMGSGMWEDAESANGMAIAQVSFDYRSPQKLEKFITALKAEGFHPDVRMEQGGLIKHVCLTNPAEIKRISEMRRDMFMTGMIDQLNWAETASQDGKTVMALNTRGMDPKKVATIRDVLFSVGLTPNASVNSQGDRLLCLEGSDIIKFKTARKLFAASLAAGYEMDNRLSSSLQMAVSAVEDFAKTANKAGHLEELGELAKTGGLITGKTVKIVGVFSLGAEVFSLNNQAQAALQKKQISQDAYNQYKLVLAGQAATIVDPTVIAGETFVSEVYENWARSNKITDPQLKEALRPGGLMQSMGMKSQTPEERQLLAFYDRLPDHVTAQTSREFADMIAVKQQIKLEALRLSDEKFKNGLLPMLSQSLAQTQVEHGLTDLQTSFARLYERLPAGAVDRHMAQTAQLPSEKTFIADASRTDVQFPAPRG